MVSENTPRWEKRQYDSTNNSKMSNCYRKVSIMEQNYIKKFIELQKLAVTGEL